MVNTRGFTILELIIAMGLTGMLVGLIGSVFVVSLKSWEQAEAEMALATTGDQVITALANGLDHIRGLEYGIEDGLEVIEGHPDSISVLPLWLEIQTPLTPERAELSVFRQSGSPPPTSFIAKGFLPIRSEGSSDGRFVFFPEPPSPGEAVEIRYRPVMDSPDALLSFTFDRNQGRISRRYKGEETQLPIYSHGVRVTALRFLYIPMEDANATFEHVSPNEGVTRAVKIEVELTKRDRKRLFSRLVVLPNAGRAIVITKRTRPKVMLPPPGKIRVLELHHASNAQKDDKIVLRAGDWRMEATFLTEDTARVRQEFRGVPATDVVLHTRFGIPMLNPDVLVDADGTDSPQRGTIGKSALLKPGALLQKLTAANIAFLDANRNASYDANETLFMDRNQSGSFDRSEKALIKLREEDEEENVPVLTLQYSDTPVLYLDQDNPGRYDDGEPIVLDINGDGQWGGAYYNCGRSDEPMPLEILQFDIAGATLIVR